MKAKARTFLRDTFGPTAGAFASRLNDATLLQDIKNVLWQDLLKPYGAQTAGVPIAADKLLPDGHMVWKQVAHWRPDVAERCVATIRHAYSAYRKFMAARRTIVQEFSKLCVRRLEHAFLRPLLESLGMLEEYLTLPVQLPGYCG